VPGVSAQQPKDDALAVHDHTLVPTDSLYARHDLRKAVIGMTYRDIAPDKLTNGGGAGTRSLPGQAIGKPIRLTGDIIKDLCEAQAFEPSRGPGAGISL
jgi:hypothetical protein